MRLKDYVKQLESNGVKPDTEEPAEVVQLCAVLAGMRLSMSLNLPISCGIGDQLDMDIIQAGVVTGLTRLPEYKSAEGTLRQFLYPTIAGAMRNYAWQRENPVSDSRQKEMPLSVSPDESETDDPAPIESALIDPATPESITSDAEDNATETATLRKTIAHLGKDATAMLIRDAQIGYDAHKRALWAAELGVSIGALSVRLARLRRDARDWALTVH